mgnify:CR=1 FL=1
MKQFFTIPMRPLALAAALAAAFAPAGSGLCAAAPDAPASFEFCAPEGAHATGGQVFGLPDGRLGAVFAVSRFEGREEECFEELRLIEFGPNLEKLSEKTFPLELPGRVSVLAASLPCVLSDGRIALCVLAENMSPDSRVPVHSIPRMLALLNPSDSSVKLVSLNSALGERMFENDVEICAGPEGAVAALANAKRYGAREPSGNALKIFFYPDFNASAALFGPSGELLARCDFDPGEYAPHKGISWDGKNFYVSSFIDVPGRASADRGAPERKETVGIGDARDGRTLHDVLPSPFSGTFVGLYRLSPKMELLEKIPFARFGAVEAVCGAPGVFASWIEPKVPRGGDVESEIVRLFDSGSIGAAFLSADIGFAPGDMPRGGLDRAAFYALGGGDFAQVVPSPGDRVAVSVFGKSETGSRVLPSFGSGHFSVAGGELYGASIMWKEGKIRIFRLSGPLGGSLPGGGE